MEFIEELKRHELLRKTGEVLDLGCHSGIFSKTFAELGYSVDAVDFKNKLTKNDKNIHFHLSKIEDFKPTKSYDVIFARNVVFFTENPIATTERYLQYLKPGGALCVSFLGKNDGWKNEKWFRPVTEKDLKDFILKNNLEELSFKESERPNGLMMNGDTKYWHMFKLVLKKPLGERNAC